MHVVALSTDRRIIDGEAPLQSAYAAAFDSFTVIVGSFKYRPYIEKALGPTGRAVLISPFTLFRLSLWRTLVSAQVITTQDPFETGWFGMLVALLFRIPLHVQVHTDFLSSNFNHSSLQYIRAQGALFVLKRARRVRVVLERIRDELVHVGVTSPVTVLPIFVDIKKFAGVSKIPGEEGEVRLLCVGRLEKEKQFEAAIRVVSELRADGVLATLTIVGEGTERVRLESAAQDSGAGEHIRFCGALDDVRPEFARADMLLVTSLFEGYGLVIIEALAAGLSVLSTDVGVAREAGAKIAPVTSFAEEIRVWMADGKSVGVLRKYPYRTREEYIKQWTDDVRSTVTLTQ